MNAPLVKLGDVCEVVRARIPIAQLTEETYISTDNMLQRRKGVTKVDKLPLKGTAVRFRPGDVLLSNIRPYLQKLWLAEREGGASSDIIVFRPKPECAPAYLFHALSQEAFFDYVMLNPSGTKMPRGRREWIARFAFPLPPLAEQERIVAHLERTLGAIDAMEAKFREMAETAERHFRATLDESFAALSSAPAAKLGEVCEVFADGDWIETRDQSTSGIRLIQTGNVGEGRFLAKDGRRRYISEGTFHRLHCTEVYPGDILISRLPDPLGRACILKDTGERMITAVDCTIMRPKQVLLPAFFVFYSCTPAYQEAVKKQATGAIRSRISRRALAQIDLTLPPLAEQERVVARLERAEGVSRRVVVLAQAGVAQCGVYRRAVLSEAFEGGVGGGGDE